MNKFYRSTTGALPLKMSVTTPQTTKKYNFVFSPMEKRSKNTGKKYEPLWYGGYPDLSGSTIKKDYFFVCVYP